MDIAKRLNRDFYIKMRIKGYPHDSLIEATFPPERKENFQSDVSDLEAVDFTKKVDVDVLIKTTSEPNPKKTTKKK
jgi:hypothetical protein